MRQIIILTDEDLDALRNDKMVKVNSRHICPEPIYLVTQKGFEIDIKCLDDLEHDCGSCKHSRKIITEEPYSSCKIRLGNDKWESKDN